MVQVTFINPLPPAEVVETDSSHKEIFDEQESF